MESFVPLWYVQHEAPLPVLIAVYLFLAGISAGLFLISTSSTVFGWQKVKPLARPAAAMALAFMVPAPLALLIDLGKPMRFINLFINFNPTSAISWGTWILALYGLTAVVYTYLLWRGEKAARTWGAAGSLFAVGLAVYTGMLLAVVTARPLWNSAMIPVLFVVSALASGIALATIAARWAPRLTAMPAEAGELLHTLKTWLIGAEVVMLSLHFLLLAAGNAAGQATVAHFLAGPRQATFLWVQVVLGLLLPLVLLLIPAVRHSDTLASLPAVLSIVGVFFLRYNFVVGGGEIPLTSHLVNHSAAPASEWIVTGALIALGLVLVAAVPAALRRFVANKA
jgi:formate-dependent nitrite reductase membrane component NrfD